MQRLSSRWWWLATLAAAITARLFLFTAIMLEDRALFLQPDSSTYWSLAGNLVQHGVFSSSPAPPLLPDHFRTPLYPLFLAPFRLLGAGPWTAVLFQVLLSTGICVAVAWAAGAVDGGRPGAPLLAGLLCALDIPSIFLADLLMSEVLFTVLLLSAFLLLIAPATRERRALAGVSGALLGLAALTRPLVLWLPFAVAGLLPFFSRLPWRQRLAAPALLLTGFVAVLTPWVGRNTVRFGSPFVSTVGYDYLYFVHGGGVLSVIENVPYFVVKSRLMEEFAQSADSKGDIMAVQLAKLARAREILVAHPLVYARNLLVGAGYSFFSPLRRDIDLVFKTEGSQTTLQAWGGENVAGKVAVFLRRGSPLTLAAVAFQAIHLLVLYAGAALCVVRRQLDPLTTTLFCVLVAYFCLTSGGPESYARFRVPLVPFFALMAGVALSPAAAQPPSPRGASAA